MEQKRKYIQNSGMVLTDKDKITMIDAIMSGEVCGGKYVKMTEDKLSNYLGLKYISLCNSGSSANLLAFMAFTSPLMHEKWRLNKGDKVITVACGFPTTISPIIQSGCIPIFCDVDSKLGINIEQLKRACDINDNVKGIFLAHTLGIPFNVNEVLSVCEKYDLFLIEDCCDALGAKYMREKVGTFGQVSTYSFYPAHHVTSLPYDEYIYIRNKNELKIVKIGDYVEYNSLYENSEAIVFNSDGKLSYQPITGVIKHECKEKLYKITVQTGRNVTVTSSHNLYYLENDEIKGKETSNFKKGDYILLPKNIPLLPEKKDIDIKLYKKGNWESYIKNIDITKEFSWFLGLFVAEGSFNKNKKSGNYNIILSLHKKESDWLNKINNAIKDFGDFKFSIFNKKETENGINMVASNKALYEFLLKYCGRGAINKKVPSFIFNSTKEIKKEFLNGYYCGDGTIHKLNNFICKDTIYKEAKTISKELATGIFYLLLSLGIQPLWNEESEIKKVFNKGTKKEYISNCKKNYKISYSNKSILDSKGFRGNHTLKRLYGDMTQAKITKIEEIDCINGFVYDISVAGYENFMTGSGMSVHNSGEGGAIATDDPLINKIVQSLRDWGKECNCSPGQDNQCGYRFDHTYEPGLDGQLPVGFDHKFVYNHFGYNLKMTNPSAALLYSQLDKLDAYIDIRKRNFSLLQEVLEEYSLFFFSNHDDKANYYSTYDPSYFGYPLLLPDTVDRQKVIKELDSKGIGTRLLFAGNILAQPCSNQIKDCIYYDLDMTNKIMTNMLWIGLWHGLTEEDINYEAKTVLSAIQNKDNLK